MKKLTKGFTLIELLVVIAIIGILSSVVLASLNSARQKGRDAKRISDVSQIKLALELYFDSNGTYPVGSGTSTAATALVPDYIPVWPLEPLAGGSYGYGGTATSYVVMADLEDDTHQALNGDIDGVDVHGVNCEDATGAYCVQP
ncbi:MAG: hypothetical protein AMXMBFR44_6560 [Candidatus Campbellbacteria bacterium]